MQTGSIDCNFVFSSPPFQKPVYNFTYLDTLIDLLYDNGLKPGFELMGNPGNIFKNFEDKSAVYDWKDLVTQTAQRYVGKYCISFPCFSRCKTD